MKVFLLLILLENIICFLLLNLKCVLYLDKYLLSLLNFWRGLIIDNICVFFVVMFVKFLMGII